MMEQEQENQVQKTYRILKTVDVIELKEQEGRVLLDDLIHHATQHQFVYRHKWKVDDVLMWDNRCTMHAVLPYDSINHRRVMHRTTVIGDSVPKA